MSLLIRRITLAALMAALVGGTMALPASSKPGPVAHAAKCKKAKKGKKKKKKCKGAGQSGTALPGQATHPNVTPPTENPTALVSAVGVTSNPVLAGQSTTGQVTINGPAPSGGQSVDLSSDQSFVTVPSSVVVAAGQTKASFPVGTTPSSSGTATLTAAIGGSNSTAPLTVVSAPSVASVTLERQCFTTSTFHGNRVTLDVPAPSDTIVQLSSDKPELGVPLSVTVPAGSKTALFDVTGSAPVTGATVTAALGTSSGMDTASVFSSTPTPVVSTLSFQPSNVTIGGTTLATVTLDCEALSGGTVVNLTPDRGVTMPLTVPVSQNQLSATFTIDTTGATSGTANIGAAVGSDSPLTAPLTISNLGT